MRIAICDDQQVYIDSFKQALVKGLGMDLLDFDEFQNGNDLIAAFNRCPYDLLFLDIEMPEIDGMELAKKLRSISEDVYIVFLTSFDEYMRDAFKVNAFRYMSKPVDVSELKEIIAAVNKKLSDGRSIIVKSPDGEHIVKLSDIIYIEAQDQQVVICTADKSYKQWAKLGEYEKLLEKEGFFRIHKSYLVSLSKIVGIKSNEITVAGGYRLPLGRSKEKEFKKAFALFVSKNSV